MPKALSTLAVGALVKDNGTKYYGKPIVWKVADKNHIGYPSDAVTLITDKIIMLKCFDDKEPDNPDQNRKNFGNNNYVNSNINLWLNAKSQNWWSATHSYDAPPTCIDVANGATAYDLEAGFLTNFSPGMHNAVMETDIVSCLNTQTEGGGTATIRRKVFLASTTELGCGITEHTAEGSTLSLFSDHISRRAKMTAECFEDNADYLSYDTSINVDTPFKWWTRTPEVTDGISVRRIDSSGSYVAGYHQSAFGITGIRPLCNLQSGVLVSDFPDSEGVYTFAFNVAPSTPDSILYPEQVYGGKTLEINWSVAADQDGNLSGYILERSVNEETYSQIYKGIDRSYTDTITFGWRSVQYRVRAYDSENAESGNQTGKKLDVTNNIPPTISGTDMDIGVKTGAFSQPYTIYDEDTDQTVTVVEKIDGNQKRNFTVTLGEQNMFTVTKSDWVELANGSHTLTVTATDNYGGSVTRTFMFAKNETEIEFCLSSCLIADDVLTKAIMSVMREIPVGAAFTLEVCNNGNDDLPTWEDATDAILKNNKFFFANTTKTAEEWGFNFRIRVSRNAADGNCFIQSVGGNYE